MKQFKFIISIISILSAAFCVANLFKSDYAAIALMPVIYAVGFLLFFPSSYRNRNSRITVILIFTLLFIRMVFLPVYGIVDSYFAAGVDSTLSRYCNLSVSLSIYELVAIALTLYVLTNNHETPIMRRDLSLSGNRIFYFVLVVVAIILYFVQGRSMGLFEFGFKSVGGEFERSGDIEESSIVRLFIGAGITFLFFLVISRFSNQYKNRPDRKYVLFSIIIAMMMISIITGERRTAQVYKGFACIWLLIGLYPVYKKRITSSLLIVAAIVIAGMTLYKQYNAFLYETYAEALSHASGVGMSTGILDAYFYGVNTISKNLAFSDMKYVGFSNLIYDFFRNFFGLNFFISRNLPITSQLYNLSLSSGEAVTGYLLSSVGYGYIYFGFILAPLFSCINVWVLVKTERLMRSSSSIEMSYILALIYMRFGFGFLGSFPPLLNLTSRTLLIDGGIVFVAWLINKSIKRL